MANDDEIWAQYRILLSTILPDEPPAAPAELAGVSPLQPPAPNVIEIELDEESEFDRRFLEQERDRGEIESIRSPHETLLADIPIDPVPEALPPGVNLLPAAEVHHHSGNFSIAYLVGQPLTPGCLLADENRLPITRVLDLIGPITSPQIILKGIFPIGLKLFAVEGDAVFPDPEQIERNFRGCDASNRYDEPEEHLDFSDDEEEHRHKMEIRKMKQAAKEEPYGYPRT
jgi:hypothetical protein